MADRVDAIAPLTPVDWARFCGLVFWTGFLVAIPLIAPRREAEWEQRVAEQQAGAAELCAEFGCVHPEVFFLLGKLSSERSQIAGDRDRAFRDERDDAGLAVRELAVRQWEEKVVLPSVREAVVAWCVRPTNAADRDIGGRARASHERRRELMDAADARGSDRRLTAERQDAHRRLARAAGSARDDVDELLAREIVLPGVAQ